MSIARQGLAQAALAHDFERDAIRERPILVGSAAVEPQALFEAVVGCFFNSHQRVRSEELKRKLSNFF